MQAQIACQPFAATFPMTLWLSSDVIATGTDLDRTHFYSGAALTSPPLALRTDFPFLTGTQWNVAERAQYLPDQGSWLHEAYVSLRRTADVDGTDYHRDVSFFASGIFPTAPMLGPQSFAEFLGTAPDRSFSAADTVERADGGFELLAYRGAVSIESGPTILEPAVTPEPASLVLLGTGLLALAVRRRTR